MWPIFAMIFCALLLASKTPLPPPSIHAREEGALVTHDKYGKERWRAQWTLRQITEDDRLLVRFTETGEGYYSHFPQRVRWTMKSYWEFGERFSPLFYEKTFSDMEGVPVVVERRRFDWKKGTVRFEREDKIGDRGVDEELEVPPTTWTVDGLATALRSLPFDSPRPVKVHLLTDEPKLYKVTFTIQGTEPIRTGKGALDCYKIKMEVNLGFFGSLFKPLLPDISFWLTVEPPHRWVRYRGPESGRGSLEVIRESIR